MVTRRAVGIAAICLLSLGGATASARPHAQVSLTIDHTVDEGAPIPFSWSGSHLGRNHKLVIQRPEGTARTWRSIMRLRARSGSAELAGLPLGKYRLRIADLQRHRVLARQVVGVAVFGQVPFSTLFEGRSNSGVYATPTNSFPYVDYWYGNEEPAFTVDHNHCQSVHIGFVPGEHHFPGAGIITVVQESHDPVSVSAQFDTIGSLDVKLVPGQSWAVNSSYKGEESPTMYINGYAYCDSAESFFR